MNRIPAETPEWRETFGHAHACRRHFRTHVFKRDGQWWFEVAPYSEVWV